MSAVSNTYLIWASQLTLRITDIDVLRVQQTTKEAAFAEGTTRVGNDTLKWKAWGFLSNMTGASPRDAFAMAWNQMNPRYPWEKNPWIIQIGFEPIWANIDNIIRKPSHFNEPKADVQ